MDTALAAWSNFNVAMVGATAALAGLVIVAASVNIAKIIELDNGSLIARMASSIASLVLALIACGLGLMPSLSPIWIGGCLLAVAGVASLFQVHAVRAILTDHHPQAQFRGAKAAICVLPVLAYLAAGVAIAMDHPAGLHLAALGCVLAIVVAIITAWVALVEVLR